MRSKSPVAIKSGKQMFYRQLELGLANAYELADEGIACDMMTGDGPGGIEALIEKGISLDLVRRAMALGFPTDAIKGQLGMPGVTAEAAEQFISDQERIRAGGEINVPPELGGGAAKDARAE